MLDRFSLGTVARDHRRSMEVYGENRSDLLAQLVLFGLPVVLGAVSYLFEWSLASPVALLPSVSLLAGVLLAACGQLISLRARIADSILLSSNTRVKSIFREAISGVVLAAVAALFAAVLLGLIAVLPVEVTVATTQEPTAAKSAAEFSGWVAPTARALTAIFTVLATFLVLMFLATARRLYLAYLEAFEDGKPLQRPPRGATNPSQVTSNSSAWPAEDPEIEGLPSSSRNFGSAPS